MALGSGTGVTGWLSTGTCSLPVGYKFWVCLQVGGVPGGMGPGVGQDHRVRDAESRPSVAGRVRSGGSRVGRTTGTRRRGCGRGTVRDRGRRTVISVPVRTFRHVEGVSPRRGVCLTGSGETYDPDLVSVRDRRSGPVCMGPRRFCVGWRMR